MEGVAIRLEKECGNQFGRSLYNPIRTDGNGWLTQPLLMGDRWRIVAYAARVGCFYGPSIGPDSVPEELVLTLPEKLPLRCN